MLTVETMYGDTLDGYSWMSCNFCSLLLCTNFLYSAANFVALGITLAGFEVSCVLSHVTPLQDQANLRTHEHAVENRPKAPPPLQKKPKKGKKRYHYIGCPCMIICRYNWCCLACKCGLIMWIENFSEPLITL